MVQVQLHQQVHAHARVLVFHLEQRHVVHEKPVELKVGQQVAQDLSAVAGEVGDGLLEVATVVGVVGLGVDELVE